MPSSPLSINIQGEACLADQEQFLLDLCCEPQPVAAAAASQAAALTTGVAPTTVTSIATTSTPSVTVLAARPTRSADA